MYSNTKYRRWIPAFAGMTVLTFSVVSAAQDTGQGAIDLSDTGGLSDATILNADELDDPGLTILSPSLQGGPQTTIATGGFTIAPSNRQQSRAFFNAVYTGSNNVASGWAGNASSPTCDEGSTTADFKERVLARVNYYRAMAGVPASLTLNNSWSADAQEAALMMSVNNALNHNPPTSWDCYTSDGATAAGESNLSWGTHGADSVRGQFRDNGSNNALVGHRRWILYPEITEVGTGDIPPGGQTATNSLWVIPASHSAPRPATREPYVAWPPPGFVPWQVVYPRWSFSWAGADFSSATVTMTKDGSPLSVTLETPGPSAPFFVGEATLVWYPAGSNPNTGASNFEPTSGDEVYTVSIEDVDISGTLTDFFYTVTVIEPGTAGTGEEAPQMSGSPFAVDGVASLFNITPISFAASHELMSCEANSGEYTNFGDASDIVDNTHAGYSAVHSTAGVSGTPGFHLTTVTPPNPSPGVFDSIEMLPSLVPGAGTQLRFQSRMRTATSDQVARAQVSTDNGNNWVTVFEQFGGSSDSSYIQRNISLAAYVGKSIRVRFTWGILEGLTSWGWNSGSSSSVGFLFDNVEVTNTTQLSNCTTDALGEAPSFNFTPNNPTPGIPQDFALVLKSFAWSGYGSVAESQTFFLTSYPSADIDSDGVDNPDDDFIDDPAYAKDTDGDGMPDDFVASCDALCRAGGTLIIDDDDDNDGVPDNIDPNPLVPGDVHPAKLLTPILELLN